MKLSRTSHARLEKFFREHLEDESFRLPRVNFYAGKFSRIFTAFINVQGITFGNRIFVMPELLSTNSKKQLRLPVEFIVHEITHSLQYKREGFFRFLTKYLRSYYQNLGPKEKRHSFSKQQAYLEIPFEIEARLTASKFSEWKNSE